MAERPAPAVAGGNAGPTLVADGWLAAALAAARVPGAAGVLVDRDLGARPFVWGRAAPWPGAAAVSPQMLFRWYSLTKPLTAALIEQLVAGGELDVAQRADHWLPEHAAALGARPGATPVTVADLLLHRAGLADRPLDAAGWFSSAGLAFPDPERALAAVLGRQPRFLAGASTRSRYSNLGYALLGQLAARATGQAFRELLHTRVLAPLGIEASWTMDAWPRGAPRSEGQVGRWSPMGWLLSTTHARSFVAGRREGWLLIRPREAIFSPHGGLVGRPAALAGLLWRRLEHGPSAWDALRQRSRRWSAEQVLPGWYQSRARGLGRIERHGGRGPGFTGELLVAPERGRALALVVNRDARLTGLCRAWLARPGTPCAGWREWPA